MNEQASIPPGLPRDNPTESYWQDPPDEIARYQTTKVLPSYGDYVIIGSGISGTCIAYNLLTRKPGARVLMLEAREACSGATGRNGAYSLKNISSLLSILDEIVEMPPYIFTKYLLLKPWKVETRNLRLYQIIAEQR